MSSYQGDAPQGRLEPARQDVIDRLTDAFANDMITMDDYERRVAEASAAATTGELDRIAFNLPAARKHPVEGSKTPRPGSNSFVYRRDSSIVGNTPVTTGCVMGDRSMTGNWLSSDRVSSFTVMGSTRLDLREVDLPPGPVRIEAFTLMGETKVIVPRGLPVKLDAFAFMGESRAGREVNQKTHGAETWVEITGFAMMGSVTVNAKD
jgi:hypothetical protein